jgi:hypothetical protein
MLTPVVNWLASAGHTAFRKEGFLIEDWPVQFLPVADDLDAEALAMAVEVEIAAGTTAMILLDEKVVDIGSLCAVIQRHDLGERWARFCATIGMPDPCRAPQ